MLNRQLTSGTLKEYGGVDAYGQQLANLISSKNIELVLNTYQHTNTEDIRYQDVKYVGLTKDTSVNDKQFIEINGTDYKIKFVVPHRVWTEMFLC